VAAGMRDLPLGQHSLIGAACRQGRKYGDWPSAISDLDTLASLDVPQ